MNIKKFYVFYSILFFIVLSPVFIIFYLLKIFDELRLKDRKYIMKYIVQDSDKSKDSKVLWEKIYGGFNNCLVKIIIEDSRNKKTLLLKKYSSFGSFFTFWGNCFAPYGNFRKITANSRLTNEVRYNRLLEKNGISVPKIIKFDKQDNVLVMDFIEGEKMQCAALDGEQLYEVGGLIAKVHSLGVYMNDNTPCNFIIKGNEIYIVDMEGFSSLGSKALDLATFIFWLKNNHISEIKFVEGYNKTIKKNGGNTERISEDDLRTILFVISSYQPIFCIGSYLRTKI